MNSIIVVILLIVVHGVISTFPVILVPGTLASHISVKYTKPPFHPICGDQDVWFTWWISVHYLIPKNPIIAKCFTETGKLAYNTTSRTTQHNNFSITKIPDFGKIESVEYISTDNIKYFKIKYLKSVIDLLVKRHNYTANKNLRAAPYDFRKAGDEQKPYFLAVKKLIEQMYDDAGRKPVILISHSMGNLLMTQLLNSASQSWKNKYIKAFLSVAAPYTGSVAALKAVVSGQHDILNFVMSREQIRDVVSTWPGMYQLFPFAGLYSNDSLVLTKEKNYTASDIGSLMERLRINFAVNHYQDIRKMNFVPQPPNVQTYCIHGKGYKTPRTIDYRNVHFPDGNPTIIDGDGDGTVAMQSLQYCGKWKGKQKKPVYESVLNTSHLEIVSDKRFLERLSEIIAEQK